MRGVMNERDHCCAQSAKEGFIKRSQTETESFVLVPFTM